jgi:hypothetical protein
MWIPFSFKAGQISIRILSCLSEQWAIFSTDHSFIATIFLNIPSPKQGASTKIILKYSDNLLITAGSFWVTKIFPETHFVTVSDRIAHICLHKDCSSTYRHDFFHNLIPSLFICAVYHHCCSILSKYERLYHVQFRMLLK